MKQLYVQIETRIYNGIYPVDHITDGTVCVTIENHPCDFYLGSGEIKKFVTLYGKNDHIGGIIL